MTDLSKKVLALRQSEEIHLGIIEQILLDLGFTYQYYDHFKPKVPLNLKQFDNVIVLGGHMGVYQTEEYPQLHHTLEVIKEAYDSGIPILGICLGAQLIAKAFGGDVYPNSQPEIGWHPINFLPAYHPYLAGMPEITQVFQWHND
ncbi:MAG TPA: gamma-glutamyl-gamma-aminobutyrate hydrolase family protein, partial [Verrucomicrobiae bacterium]|nr:gamma-glutamyl-gamma-aminobutyrate hydrolase family protein [Verrucomicrobiae bacterium]